MAADVGIKIQLEGEREYKKSLKEIISQQKEWDSEIKAVESALDDETSAQEKARKKADLLTKSIDSQQKKIGLMKDQLEKVEEVYGKDSEQAKKLRTQINQATTALNKMKAQAKSNAEKMKDLGKSMKEAGEKMQKIGTAATKYISAPIGAAAGLAVKAWYEVDDALDTITIKTGATGKALEDMQDIARSIATTIPTDFNTAAEAVGEINTRFGVTDDILEELSTQFVKFSAITGQDVTSAVDGVQKAMAAFNMDADEAPAMLDALAKASQNSGVKVDKLEESLVKNAASLSQMGMSATDAVGFLAQLETSGANTETVMSGLQKAMTNAVGNGQTLPELLAEFQSYMTSGASETEKLQKACEYFGKKAGPAIYEACKNGSLDFSKLAGAAEDAAGTVDQTFNDIQDEADKFTIAKNKLTNSASELGGAILDTVAPAVDKLSGYVADAAGAFGDLDEGQQQLVLAAGGFALGIGPFLTGLGWITSKAGDAVIALGDVGTKAIDVIAAGGPVSLAMGAIAALAAVMVTARENALNADETLQSTLALCETATTELNDATSALNTVISDAEKNYDDINAKAQTAGDLITRLEELESQSNKTAAEIGEMRLICSQLNEMYPGLNASIDENTGALNKGTGEMRQYVEQARKMALIEAYTTASKDATLALAEASIKLTQARNAEKEAATTLAQKEAELAEIERTAPRNYKGEIISAAYDEASNAVYKLGVAHLELVADVEAAQAEVDATEEKIGLYTQAQEELTAELGLAGDQAEETGEQLGELGDMTDALAEDTEEDIDEIAQAYQKLYDSALSTISGGIGLFDKFEQEEKATTASMIEGLNSQADAFEQYGDDLTAVLAWTAENADENTTAFVNALIDMGMDGADEMQALAAAIDSGSGDVDTILATFGNITGNKDLIAKMVADFRSGIDTEFEGISDDIEEESGEASTAAEEFGEGVASAAGSNKGDIADEATQLGEVFDNTRNTINVERALAKTEATAFGTTVSRSLKDKVSSVKQSAQSLGDATDGARVRINAQKPRAQAAALAFGGAIVNSLNSKKQSITTAAGSMVDGGPGAIEGKTSLYYNAGGKLGSSVGDGIKAKATAVQTAASSLASSVSGASGSFSSAGSSLGSSAASGVASGFSGNAWRISSAVSGGASYVNQQYSTFVSAGENIGRGIAVGIANKTSLVNQVAANLAQSAAATINRELKINSPAKVVIPSGEAIAEGLEVGMERRMGYVERAAAGLSRAAVPEVATGAGIAASRSTGSDAIYNAVYAAVRAAAPSVVINEKSFKRALVTMGVSVA